MEDNRGVDLDKLVEEVIGGGPDDVVTQLVEVCEATERTYRAAVEAGVAVPGLSSSTNF